MTLYRIRKMMKAAMISLLAMIFFLIAMNIGSGNFDRVIYIGSSVVKILLILGSIVSAFLCLSALRR